ncbi:DUF262 domain-containing protein, partial [Acidithiobacillus caldus]|uniref:DUF262 domain-containing protein n=1 Tax=Acidithiobacillus caldus TaxID=33059 RepID=UPI001C065859
GSSVRTVKLTEWLSMCSGKSREYSQYQVVLPMIQRGFVWKPNQIIELWDSLLQGMPIGTLMLSEMKSGTPYLEITRDASNKINAGSSDKKQLLGLIDGQQRTLAMLTGWARTTQESPRLWVDFGDEPPPGHLVRMRVTTRNQPYGYRRDNPNARLTMDERRCAKKAYIDRDQMDYPPHPNGARYSLPFNITELLQAWNEKGAEAWKAYIHRRIESVQMLHCRDERTELKQCWPDMPQDLREEVSKRVEHLSFGFANLYRAEIPLLRVNPEFFDIENKDSIEPPLARLFKRIGSNATPLSDADYIYSILKYMMPEVHRMVEDLHGRKNVASLMTATDLVMSALRLAAVTWEGEIDRDNPTKEDFHRMIWPKSKDTETSQNVNHNNRQENIRQLLEPSKIQSLAHYFETVQVFIEYNDDWRDGIPSLFFPYLERPLVQVLLRLAQAGYLYNSNKDDKYSVVRLVLWWTQWVTDKPKASRIAFRTIKDSEPSCTLLDLTRNIYSAIINEDAGMRIWSPISIQEAISWTQANNTGSDGVLIGNSRFNATLTDTDEVRLIRAFYRHWWRPWTHKHPLLLWLQREYVKTLKEKHLAGEDDETPYDFDHILPRSHWGDWTGKGNNEDTIMKYFAPNEWKPHVVLGNSIGNVRVIYFSDNRHDGDMSPKIKFKETQPDVLRNSAIDKKQLPLWIACSPTDENHKQKWDRERAIAFQQAIETRAFALFRSLYDQAHFEKWFDPELA